MESMDNPLHDKGSALFTSITMEAVTKSLWSKFVERGKVVFIPRGQHLSNLQNQHYCYYILEGSCGVFLQTEEGKTLCLELFMENEYFHDRLFNTDNFSFPTETIAIEDLIVMRISKVDFNTLKCPETGVLLSVLYDQHCLKKLQFRQIEMLTKTAEVRYQELLVHFPHIVKRIPLFIVASYLGITIQSLSRIRANLSKK
mgnify:CR=1 FL=1